VFTKACAMVHMKIKSMP